MLPPAAAAYEECMQQPQPVSRLSGEASAHWRRSAKNSRRVEKHESVVDKKVEVLVEKYDVSYENMRGNPEHVDE